jgi:hypothetical protein
MDANKTTEKINAEEFAVAEKEAEKSGYTYTHKFAKPFECEEKKYEELTFDWGGLTGTDSLAIEREMAQLGLPLVTPEFSGEYLVRMAARACTTKIGSDVLCRLPLKDFNRIRNRARSFLLKLEL